MAMVLNAERTRTGMEKERHEVFAQVRDLRGVAAAVADLPPEIMKFDDEYGDDIVVEDGRGIRRRGTGGVQAKKSIGSALVGVSHEERRNSNVGFENGELVEGEKRKRLSENRVRPAQKKGVRYESEDLSEDEKKKELGENRMRPVQAQKQSTSRESEEFSDDERRRRFAESRLSSSTKKMIEDWAADAARATAVQNAEESKSDSSSSSRSAPEKSHWTRKEGRTRFECNPLTNNTRNVRRDDGVDGDVTSHATSTRALATATHKPSFDTEVSPRSAPPSPAPPASTHVNGPQAWSTSYVHHGAVNQSSGGKHDVGVEAELSSSLVRSPSKAADRQRIEKAQRSTVEDSKKCPTVPGRPSNDIVSRSITNEELSATIERFRSFGGGIHTSFTARSTALRPKAEMAEKRVRRTVDEIMDPVTSGAGSFTGYSWQDFESFMRRGLMAMSDKRIELFERMLIAIKSISIVSGILNPPSIPASLSVLTDEVEKNVAEESPAASDLFNQKIDLLVYHVQAICVSLRRQNLRVASARKPPRPTRVKSGIHRELSKRESEVKENVVAKKGNEVTELPETQNQRKPATPAEGRVPPPSELPSIRSGESVSNSVSQEYEVDESQLYPLDLAHQISNPMRVTFISVKSYGNSEASSRSLNFGSHAAHRQAYSKYRMSSLSSIPSSKAVSLNSSFTRIDFVPQPPYTGPRPSMVEQSAGEYYSSEPIYYRWKISRVIGRGSFSQIRVATSLRESFRAKIPCGLVAVKLVQKNAVDLLTKDGVCREVASYVRLSKNNTMANLLEVSEDANTVYLVIEHLGGGLLFNRIAYPEFYPKYNERDVAYFIRQLASALKDSHAANIIHRDVKPENVLFENEYDAEFPNRSSQIVLVDYGIAHVGPEPANEVLGTPLYMAPEVLLKQVYDTKADMWSLGVVTHIMLVGCAPFDDNDPEELIRRIKFEQVKIEGELWQLISESGRDFVKKLLVKDPLKRISAEEALKHEWLNDKNCDDMNDKWPHLEVTQVALQSVNARNSLDERNRMEKILIEQEQNEEDIGLLGNNRINDFDHSIDVEYDNDSGIVTRQLTAFADGQVGTHAITQPTTTRRRQKVRRWIRRRSSLQQQQPQPKQRQGTNKNCNVEMIDDGGADDDDKSASTISVPMDEASANLAQVTGIKNMKSSMVRRRDADVGEGRNPTNHYNNTNNSNNNHHLHHLHLPVHYHRKNKKRKNRPSIWPGKKKLSNDHDDMCRISTGTGTGNDGAEKVRRRRATSGLSPSGLYSRIQARLPSQNS